jgi:hypothetical protein
LERFSEQERLRLQARMTSSQNEFTVWSVLTTHSQDSSTITMPSRWKSWDDVVSAPGQIRGCSDQLEMMAMAIGF